jgi:hypothetical protein
MFDHEPKRFREPEDCVGRFASRIGEVLDREKRAVNVVMSVDEEQLHVNNLARERPFPNLMLLIMILLMIVVVTIVLRRDQEQDQDQEQEFQTQLAIRSIRG